VRVSELNKDILFPHARELAMELIGVTSLAGVKLGLPVEQPSAVASLTLAGVIIKIVKEP